MVGRQLGVHNVPPVGFGWGILVCKLSNPLAFGLETGMTTS